MQLMPSWSLSSCHTLTQHDRIVFVYVVAAVVYVVVVVMLPVIIICCLSHLF